MKNKIYFLISFVLLWTSEDCLAQNKKTSDFQQGLLWEISGKDLAKPSYIYGTYHLLNEDYVNSLTSWKEKFEQCNLIVGEVIMDSSKLQGLYQSMMMPDKSLKNLLTEEEYKRTADFLKEVSGFDLTMFNSFKPMALSTILSVFIWAKQNPSEYDPKKLSMDVYFQKLGKENGKELKALESMEEQSEMLFSKISLERQKEMLMSMVNKKEQTMDEFGKLDKCYRNQDLNCILNAFYSTQWDYKEEEINMLVNDRNKAWIPKLTSIMKQDAAFIAIGAGHLPGDNGVLNLLKKQGYKVKRVDLK